MPTTTNFGWTTPADTDLVKDGALAIRTLGNGVDTSLVDLKGGATGDSLIKASATDLDYSWTRFADQVLANPVINGGMDLWQRGTSSLSAATSAATGFTADRWQMWRTGFAVGLTGARQNTGDTTNLPNIQYSARVQRDSGNTSTAVVYFTSCIETNNSRPFSGKTVTLSFYAKAGANYSGASSNLVANLITGTGTDQNITAGLTGQVSPINANATLTTSWQRFAFTGTIASTATEMVVQFSYTPVGTASTNDWFEVTGVQLDVGTFTAANAPTFRRSGDTYASELAACQRYYMRFLNGRLGAGYAKTTTTAAAYIQFPVKMRTAPTAVEQNGTAAHYQIVYQNTATACSAVPAFNQANETGADITFTVASGLTAGDGVICAGNNSTSYLGFSAEL